MAAELIVRGHQLVASADPPAGRVIEGGAAAVAGDEIVAVGSFEDLRQKYPDARVVGSDRHLVIPGLINSHHHGWGLTVAQLGGPDGLLEPWLIDLISLPHLDHYSDILYAAMKLIRSGVTTVQHSGISRDFGALEHETSEALRAYEDSGMRVAYAVQARNRNSYVYEDDEEFMKRLDPDVAKRLAEAAEGMGGATEDEIEELQRATIDRYRDHPRIGVLLCAEGPEWCTDDLLRRLRGIADELEVGIHLHCLESPYQREYLRREYGTSVVRHLDEIGLLGPDVSLAHAVWLTEDEMDLCAERGVSICHNPSSNLRLRVGIAPVPVMVERGVNVAIGVDSTGINDDDDMLQELGLAARLHRLPRSLGLQWVPSEVDILRMATANGAKAIGKGETLGKIEPGRKADLVLLDYERMTEPYIAPGQNPIEVLVGRGRSRHVDTVIIGGETVLADGEFVNLDEEKVKADLAESARKPMSPRVRRWVEALNEIRPVVEEFYSGWPEPEYRPAYAPNSLE